MVTVSPACFPEGFAHVGLDGKLVGAVSQGHERALEWVSVDRAADLHQASGAIRATSLSVEPVTLAVS